MKTARFCLLSLLLCISATATSGAPPATHLDPTSPVSLNEYALEKLATGDIGTAVLLLERAVLLAPYDVRLRRNLELVRAWQEGRPVSTLPPSASPPAPAIPAPASGDTVLPGAPWGSQ